MGRIYFLKTDRLGFDRWRAQDGALAGSLWGDGQVTRYICAAGRFSPEEVAARLALEVANEAAYHVQYWPVFTLDAGELAGCCGLRPHGENAYELGVHLRPAFWRQGYGTECARAAIGYAFTELQAQVLFAGHNPRNEGSRKLLGKLGFTYVGDEFYAPTGLYHPSYRLERP